MNNRSLPIEGCVVRGQSKVEKAKYIHTENHLRQNLQNISESFKRQKKRLNDETKILRLELHRLQMSIVEVQREKKNRAEGKYKHRRPHRAEKLLNSKKNTYLRSVDEKHLGQRKSVEKRQTQKKMTQIKTLYEKKLLSNEKEEQKTSNYNRIEEETGMVSKMKKNKIMERIFLPQIDANNRSKLKGHKNTLLDTSEIRAAGGPQFLPRLDIINEG